MTHDPPDYLFVVGQHRVFKDWLREQPDAVRERVRYISQFPHCRGFRGTAAVVRLHGYDIRLALDVEEEVCIMNGLESRK